MPKSTVSVESWASAVPAICASVDRVPNTANQMLLKIVGTKIGQPKNERIDRPREIRAMNTPTKGAQAIHQAQWKNAYWKDSRRASSVPTSPLAADTA